MATSITALEAETLTLRLAIRDEHIAYSIYKEGGEPLLSGEQKLDPQLSASEALGEALYAVDSLVLPYGRVEVEYMPCFVSLIPESLCDDNALGVWLTTMCGERASERYRLLRTKMPHDDKVLLGVMPLDIYDRLKRIYIYPEFVPSYLTALVEGIEACRKGESGEEARQLLFTSYSRMTIAVVGREGLQFINNFDYISPWQTESRGVEEDYYMGLMRMLSGAKKSLA